MADHWKPNYKPPFYKENYDIDSDTQQVATDHTARMIVDDLTTLSDLVKTLGGTVHDVNIDGLGDFKIKSGSINVDSKGNTTDSMTLVIVDDKGNETTLNVKYKDDSAEHGGIDTYDDGKGPQQITSGTVVLDPYNNNATNKLILTVQDENGKQTSVPLFYRAVIGSIPFPDATIRQYDDLTFDVHFWNDQNGKRQVITEQMRVKDTDSNAEYVLLQRFLTEATSDNASLLAERNNDNSGQYYKYISALRASNWRGVHEGPEVRVSDTSIIQENLSSDYSTTVTVDNNNILQMIKSGALRRSASTRLMELGLEITANDASTRKSKQFYLGDDVNNPNDAGLRMGWTDANNAYQSAYIGSYLTLPQASIANWQKTLGIGANPSTSWREATASEFTYHLNLASGQRFTVDDGRSNLVHYKDATQTKTVNNSEAHLYINESTGQYELYVKITNGPNANNTSAKDDSYASHVMNFEGTLANQFVGQQVSSFGIANTRYIDFERGLIGVFGGSADSIGSYTPGVYNADSTLIFSTGGLYLQANGAVNVGYYGILRGSLIANNEQPITSTVGIGDPIDNV